MYTKEQIFAQLQAMNAPRDSVVTVHSSLRSVGEVEGRGEGFLQILIDYFTGGGGLLVIPSHTWDFLNEYPKYALDQTMPRTNLGMLPTLAVNHPDGLRSEHPTHSVVVFGDRDKAEEFIRDDGISGSFSSPKGCYGKLYRAGGKVLLIGVGHDKNTYLHCVEEMLGVKNRVEKAPRTFLVKRKDGSEFETKMFYYHADGIEDVSEHYPKLEPAFRHFGCITDGYVGDAKSMLCDAVRMKETAELVYGRSHGRELMADDAPLDKALYL